MVSRFDIVLVRLDPTVGSEMQKTRPCAVVSPDVLNRVVRTVIVVPLTSSLHPLPFRIRSQFRGHTGQFAVDHTRSVSVRRLGKRVGRVDALTGARLLEALRDMFAP